MRYTVVGADRETGEGMELTVEAQHLSEAKERAYLKGMVVSHVVPVIAAAPHRPQPEQGHIYGAPVINVAMPRRGNSCGVAAIVLGLVAFLICWIPLVNLLSLPLSGLGLLLGLLGILIAITRGGASIGYPIAGSAICGLSLLVTMLMTTAIVGGIKSASDVIAKESARREATNQVVVGSDVQLPGEGAIWAPAGSPVQQGDVEIQVSRVRVARVPMTGRGLHDGAFTGDKIEVMIELDLRNVSSTRKAEYRSWGVGLGFLASDSGVLLTDNFGNKYLQHTRSGISKPVGAVDFEPIYPDKSVHDVLVFEPPVDSTEHLDLTLPAENFGGSGMLRIRIPGSMIERSPE